LEDVPILYNVCYRFTVLVPRDIRPIRARLIQLRAESDLVHFAESRWYVPGVGVIFARDVLESHFDVVVYASLRQRVVIYVECSQARLHLHFSGSKRCRKRARRMLPVYV